MRATKSLKTADANQERERERARERERGSERERKLLAQLRAENEGLRQTHDPIEGPQLVDDNCLSKCEILTQCLSHNPQLTNRHEPNGRFMLAT